MKGTVLYDVKDGIAILTVDNPPVNPLSDGVRTGLFESLVKAEEDSSVSGVVLTGNGRAFIAGADISEFGGNVEGVSLNEVFNKLEYCTKPVVAAINGIALGGGLETALCCNYRIADKNAFVEGSSDGKLNNVAGNMITALKIIDQPINTILFVIFEYFWIKTVENE